MMTRELSLDSIFNQHGTGLNALVGDAFYDFDRDALEQRMMSRGDFDSDRIAEVLIRPYTKQYAYITVKSAFFPMPDAENIVIALSAPQSDDPFTVIMTNTMVDAYLPGINSRVALFAFYHYEDDTRHENISDDSLHYFRDHYKDETISKWDIFHYIYALLHHPHFNRSNTKYTFPLITLVPDFRLFCTAGERLAKLHMNYERTRRFRLEWAHDGFTTTTFRVKQMRFNHDRTAILANNAFTLTDIPAYAHDYQVGAKSALEWVVDEHRIYEDPYSGVLLDPNLYKDTPQEGGRYILLLVERVLQVSLETRRILHSLEALPLIA